MSTVKNCQIQLEFTVPALDPTTAFIILKGPCIRFMARQAKMWVLGPKRVNKEEWEKELGALFLELSREPTTAFGWATHAGLTTEVGIMPAKALDSEVFAGNAAVGKLTKLLTDQRCRMYKFNDNGLQVRKNFA